MMRHRAILALLAALPAGCASIDDLSDLERFYEHRPRTILVLPVRNLTTDAEAPRFFMATLSEPLVARGYYPMPPLLVAEILAQEGIGLDGQAWEVDPGAVHEHLGADAILYVTLEEWDTHYLLLASSVNVGLHYRLVDARTGLLLWERRGRRAIQSRSSSGGGLAGLLVMAIDAAVTAATVDYVPVAAELNRDLLSTLPPGSYHPGYPALQARLEEWRRTKQAESRPAAPPSRP